MLDSMFQEGTDKALDDRVSRPLQAPVARPSFSIWNTVKAPFTGFAAGVNDAAGMSSDILGAFGSSMAAYGLQADPSLLFSGDEQKKRFDAGQKSRDEIESGAAFSTDIGSGFRSTARSFAPDPTTANAAEQMLFGISRVMTKAVGYTVLSGPAAGATLTGVDEGMAEADRLKVEGVDMETRIKAGAVIGLSTGVGVALPVAGKTVAQSAALVIAGGPASFMAQQAASKSILQNAGYDQIAEQYDPFDPVGLAVSTLVPAAFGAYAMRGAKVQPKPVADPVAARALGDMGGNERKALRYDDPRIDAYTVTAAQREGVPPELMLALKNAGEKSGPTAVSPKGATGVAQLMPENQRKYGVTDPTDPIQSIDGMAKYLRDTMKQYDGNIQAVIADYNGGPRQAKRVLEGKEPAAAETSKYLRRVNDYLAERQGTEAGKAVSQDPEAVAAARVQLARDSVESSNLAARGDAAGATDHLNAVMKASDQLAAGERVSVSDAFEPSRLDADKLKAFAAQLEPVAPLQGYHGTKAVFDSFDDAFIGSATGKGRGSGLGFWFSSEKDAAAIFSRIGSDGQAGRVIAADLHLVKPYEMSNGEYTRMMMETSHLDADGQFSAMSAFRKDLQTQGFDGIVVKKQDKAETIAVPESARARVGASEIELPPAPKGSEGAGDRFIAFDAGQIKPQKPAGAKPETKPANAATKAPGSASVQPPGAPKPAGEGSTTPSPLDAQIAEIARLSPETLVQLEGMDAPMRLTDALEAVRAEAAREAADAPLLQVAAECFLRTS